MSDVDPRQELINRIEEIKLAKRAESREVNICELDAELRQCASELCNLDYDG